MPLASGLAETLTHQIPHATAKRWDIIGVRWIDLAILGFFGWHDLEKERGERLELSVTTGFLPKQRGSPSDGGGQVVRTYLFGRVDRMSEFTHLIILFSIFMNQIQVH